MPLKCIYFKTALLVISGWKIQTGSAFRTWDKAD